MKNAVVVALRISAVFLALRSLDRAAATLPHWEQLTGQIDTSVLAALVMIFLPAIVALAFWGFAPAMARLVLSPSFDDKIQISWPIPVFEKTAYSIVGVIVLTWAVPDAFYWLAVVVQGAEEKADLGSISIATPEIVTTVIELIIGLWLLFGARGLSDFLAKVKAAGRPSNQEMKVGD